MPIKQYPLIGLHAEFRARTCSHDHNFCHRNKHITKRFFVCTYWLETVMNNIRDIDVNVFLDQTKRDCPIHIQQWDIDLPYLSSFLLWTKAEKPVSFYYLARFLSKCCHKTPHHILHTFLWGFKSPVCTCRAVCNTFVYWIPMKQ